MYNILKRESGRRDNLGRGEGGFTLVELLIVIVILGVLSAVVVFAVGGINDKGEESACKATSNAVQTASEAFYATSDDGTYAATLQDLDPEFLRLPTAEGAVDGNEITLSGKTITYNPATGAVTDNCDTA